MALIMQQEIPGKDGVKAEIKWWGYRWMTESYTPGKHYEVEERSVK